MKSQQRTNNTRIWYDSSLIETPSDSLFDPAYWQSQGLVLGSAKGRGTTWFVQTPKINAALRHFYRGGLLGKLIKDSYLFVTWGLTRSAQEFLLLQELRQCGVSVPRPVAARAIKKGLFYQADILTELVDGAQDLLAVLSNRSLTTAEYEQIGQEIGKMHQAQINHTDLNIHNILLDKNNKVWLIDFDKCKRQKGHAWKTNNIERLKRSFIKEAGKQSLLWQEEEFDLLLQGYKRVSQR